MSFHGISTIRLHADDHTAIVAWYSEVFEQTPYFERPGYAEFRVGQYEVEVGIMDSGYLSTLGNLKAPAAGAGSVIYWHVDDMDFEIARLVKMGGTVLEERREFGPGFVAATLSDPFGNVIGVMENKHFRELAELHGGAKH